MRVSKTDCILQGQATEQQINCGTFNSVVAEMFALGTEDNDVSIWDSRKPSESLNDLSFHESQVTCVEWHPSNPQICVSGSDDGKVYVWDNTKNGEE